MSIYEHFTNRLGREPEDVTLMDLPVASPCGRDCRRVIDAALPLIKAADTSIEEEIVSVVEHAVSVYWRG
jgi:hypothetical protein